MFDTGERILLAALGVLCLIGWALFGLCVWKHREPPEVSSMKQEAAVQDLRDAGFVEVPIAAKPPVGFTAPSFWNAPPVVVAKGSVPPKEQAPPQVFADENTTPPPVGTAENTTAPNGHQLVPNWSLSGDDLGLKDWTFVARRVGRRAFVQLGGTLEAVTPAGTVERVFVTDPGDERGWVAASALPGARYIDFELGATTRRTMDFTVQWGNQGKLGWGVGPAYDFDRRQWDVRATMRIPTGW